MSIPYPSDTELKAIDAAEELMKETMARYDPSHDAYHVSRVRKTALSIAHAIIAEAPTGTKPDLLVVELAALLHDVLDKKYVTPEQAADPYGFFQPFFAQVSEVTSGNIDLVKDGRGKQITQIIDNVSWSTEKKLRAQGQWGEWHEQCVELHCVQDADRLDAIGAFGVLRCAAFNSTKNSPLHTPKDDPERENSAIQHFYDKLIHIQSRLKTEQGKAMGKKRHELILHFLSAIDEEYGT